MSVINDLEKVVKQMGKKKKYANVVIEYNNAIAILSDQKLITSGKFPNVMNDLNAVINFEMGYSNPDNEKIAEYKNAIAKLANASI